MGSPRPTGATVTECKDFGPNAMCQHRKHRWAMHWSRNTLISVLEPPPLGAYDALHETSSTTWL